MELISKENTLKSIISRLGIKGEKYLLQSEKVIYEEIKNAPPIDAKPIEHGKWLENTSSGHLYCSKCGLTLDDEGYYSNEVQAKENKYCKNCGTKMDLIESE